MFQTLLPIVLIPCLALANPIFAPRPRFAQNPHFPPNPNFPPNPRFTVTPSPIVTPTRATTSSLATTPSPTTISSTTTTSTLTTTFESTTTSTFTTISSFTTTPSFTTVSTTALSSSFASSSSAAPASSSSAPNPTLGPLDKYKTYVGDGSVADGWPGFDQWADFDYMWEYNAPNMKTGCAAWDVPDDSDEELADMKQAILDVSAKTTIDARFILAIIMQESTGCVRVITTAYAHANPGLMQSFNGTGSCNSNGAGLNVPGVAGDGEVLTPCPQTEIYQMVSDGTAGTQWGPGLQQDYAQQGHTDVSGYYRTARLYNGGSLDPSGELTGPCCTQSYASDIANRLTGWVNAPHNWTG